MYNKENGQSQTKLQAEVASVANSSKHLRKIFILHRFFQRIEKRGDFQTHFMHISDT